MRNDLIKIGNELRIYDPRREIELIICKILISFEKAQQIYVDRRLGRMGDNLKRILGNLWILCCEFFYITRAPHPELQ